MQIKGVQFWLVVLILFLVQLACSPLDALDTGNFMRDPEGYCQRWPNDERCHGGNLIIVYDPTDPVPEITPEPQPTLETSDLQPVSTPVLTSGACAWVRSADSDGYPSGEVKEGVRVGGGDIPTSLRTYFSHGKTGCDEQVFATYHAWYLDEVYHPGKPVDLSVVFAWNNVGTADCASLAMAGGSTAISVGNVQVKAQDMSINIRTDPQGELSESGTWDVPEGTAGDILTITQNVSTGVYGTNIRWRYEYVCD